MQSLISLSLMLTLLCFSSQVSIADEITGIVDTPTVSRILGKVKVLRGNKFETVKSGMKLRQGDEIRTGRRGRAYIDFPDNSRVKLGNRSRFLVRDWGVNAGIFSSTLRIFQGAFRYTAGFISNGLNRNTTLTTRTAVLGVRGTDFWGRVDKDKTFLLLLEGEVSLAPRFGEAIVYNEAGSAVTINASTISEPKALSVEAITPLAEETEIEGF